jgi:hypothetical protein
MNMKFKNKIISSLKEIGFHKIDELKLQEKDKNPFDDPHVTPRQPLLFKSEYGVFVEVVLIDSPIRNSSRVYGKGFKERGVWGKFHTPEHLVNRLKLANKKAEKAILEESKKLDALRVFQNSILDEINLRFDNQATPIDGKSYFVISTYRGMRFKTNKSKDGEFFCQIKLGCSEPTQLPLDKLRQVIDLISPDVPNER